MGANKIGSYIVQYRSKRKEAAEEEKRRRIEDVQRRPAIIDPSFELFGHSTPSSQRLYDGSAGHDTPTTSPANSDWLFQSREASTLPSNYQFDAYCEVTPKSSVSSQNSAVSDVSSSRDYGLGFDGTSNARPRPQSYLPSSASASYSLSMTDLHRSTEYNTRRRSGYAGNQQESLPSYDRCQQSQPSYGLQASLTRPFSIDEPLESLSEPLRHSHLYRQSSEPAVLQGDMRLPSVPEHTDDLIKRGYIN